ncbi:MAG: Hsp70 family protein [Myxococcales bacterium]|nr:Hsp70 family protein [Myxococcales bacterium]
MSEVILGIDLGTTNTVIAVTQGEQILVLGDERGNKLQPSVVAFHPNGSILVGEEAKARRAIDPRNTLFSIKRLIGRGMLARETREMCERMPFEIYEGSNQQPIIKTRAGSFSAPEVSALLLRRIKTIAETALGREAHKAVITVPASFGEAQRSATTAAGTIAGLDVVRIINEPTAAAVAFGYRKNLRGTIAIYDFGGGTFDISILRVKGARFEVLGSAGNPFLGGDDIDNLLVRRMSEEFLERHKIDLHNDPMAVQRLQGIAERVKIELAARTRSLVNIEELAYGDGGKPIDFETAITRDELEKEAGSLIRQTFPVCDEAMHRASLSSKDIDALVLVGGTTRMPLVREMAAKYFGQDARTDVNPDEAIAAGAALHGAAMAARAVHVGRRTSPGMGKLQPALIPEPDSRDKKAGKYRPEDEITNILPGDEEVINIGRLKTVKRAVSATPPDLVGKGGGISESIRESALSKTAGASGPVASTRQDVAPATDVGPIIFEIAPQALSLATVAGFCEHIIAPNAPVPTEVVRTFATSKDGQQEVRLRICQGNARMIDENVALGMLILDGLEAAPRGHVKIEVAFRLDASGRLHVRANCPVSGLEQQATLDVIGAQSTGEVRAAQERLLEIPS